MIGNTSLQYHRAVLELLGNEPSLSVDAAKRVAERERVSGTVFPASVKEWFSLEAAKGMFDGNGKHLESIEELGRPEETQQGYLRVATEIQGVVGWYVRLDQSDDPPFYDNNDQWEEGLSHLNWNSPSFTNFISDTIARLRFDGWGRGCYLVATAEQPDAAVLDTLRANLKEGPRTHEFPE